MNKAPRKYFLPGLIIVNSALWGLFIIPGVIQLFTRAPAAVQNKEVLKETKVSREYMEKADFQKLRNPFGFGGDFIKNSGRKSLNHNPEKRKNTNTVQQTVKGAKFTSRFRLKSIVQLKDKYSAALEEMTAVSEGGDSDSPYRFFNPSEQSPPSKTLLVMEGDNVEGETVVKITSEYVIMQKSGKYYKLTFSGGMPVDKP